MIVMQVVKCRVEVADSVKHLSAGMQEFGERAGDQGGGSEDKDSRSEGGEDFGDHGSTIGPRGVRSHRGTRSRAHRLIDGAAAV